MTNYNTVKRHFETVLKNCPTTKSQIVPTLEGVTITAAYEDDNYLGFEAISSTKHGYCSCCGSKITRLKQYKTTYTTIAVINSKNVILKLRKKMYYCHECNKSTTEKLLDTSGKNQKTNGFLATSLKLIKETMTYSTVARLLKMSVANVMRHFDKARFAETEVDRSKVKNLCVDEVRMIEDRHYKYQFVIMDADNNSVLDILKTRHADFIKEYLRENYRNVKTVTMDLWKTYRNVFSALYPDVIIIADRFHVVRQFMWAFSRTRIALANEQGVSTNKNWRLLTKAKDKLSERGREKLEKLLAADPAPKVAHNAKEMALEMLRGNDKEKYLKMLPELKRYIDDNNLVEFVEAYNTLINWHEEILNMFDYPYSNGAMERINRSIKQIKNICYGVKSLPRTLKLVQYRVN